MKVEDSIQFFSFLGALPSDSFCIRFLVYFGNYESKNSPKLVLDCKCIDREDLINQTAR
jgi:hypothetical protein